ncbi:hypothetical protein BH23GEM9_BH23GEM9_31060 [soil metagenome]
MIRHWKTVIAAVGIVIAGFSTDASAQAFGIGAGPSFPLSVLGDEFETGYHVQLSAGLAPASLPVGLRFDGAYNYFPEDDGHFRVISGSANAVLALPMSGLSPYIIGGLGVYNSRGEHDDEVEAGHGHESVTNLGGNIGAGIRFALPGLSVFVEARLHNVFSEGEQVRFIPLTLGIQL